MNGCVLIGQLLNGDYRPIIGATLLQITEVTVLFNLTCPTLWHPST